MSGDVIIPRVGSRWRHDGERAFTVTDVDQGYVYVINDNASELPPYMRESRIALSHFGRTYREEPAA